MLSGAEYILIRPGILKSNGKKGDSRYPKVLVVGGGSDPFGYVPAIAEVIQPFVMELEVDLVTNERISTEISNEFIFHPVMVNST